jgi:hypothetical protein
MQNNIFKFVMQYPETAKKNPPTIAEIPTARDRLRVLVSTKYPT